MSNLPIHSLAPGLSYTELNLSSLAERFEVSNLEQMGNLTWAFKQRLNPIRILYSISVHHINPSPQCVHDSHVPRIPVTLRNFGSLLRLLDVA